MNLDRPVTFLVCALGGEGGGVLAEWLVDTAVHAGHSVQSTSIPGVAQRTGATTYYVEIYPRPDAELNGRTPVFSLTPVPGALDLLVSSELLETVRQIGHGMTNVDRTQVISSRSRTLTTAEKMPLGDGRASAEVLMQIVRAHSAQAFLLDMAALTQAAGTVISAVLFGAIAASGVLPFGRAACRATIGAGGKGVAASLRGFDAAFEALSGLRVERAALERAVADAVVGAAAQTPVVPTAPAAPLPPAAVPSWLAAFPDAAHDMIQLGHARVLEYQDARYARLYLERLQRVLAAERAGDADAANGFATTRETARHLALWMAFDDIVRVADLKSRSSRWQRVKGEVKAGDEDLLQVYDHFKPGAPEFAALLPPALSLRLLRWDRRRVLEGKSPWALPLKIGTHSVSGMLSLRVLASLKWLRVRGARFANEQAMIEKWLGGVVAGTRQHWQLGHEIALCGRLIKGYGATNERGKENLLHVLDHLAGADHPPDENAAAIAAARAAALADNAGIALDATLLRHGAPARPVKEQPLRFVRRVPALASKES
jgi:indolepyruvate ferredoxin oxidoreductase beta subunit